MSFARKGSLLRIEHNIMIIIMVIIEHNHDNYYGHYSEVRRVIILRRAQGQGSLFRPFGVMILRNNDPSDKLIVPVCCLAHHGSVQSSACIQSYYVPELEFGSRYLGCQWLRLPCTVQTALGLYVMLGSDLRTGFISLGCVPSSLSAEPALYT